MQISESASWINPGSEHEDTTNFYKSLQELRDLRPQLHQAAKLCESKFFYAREKRIVLDNTKEYICRALVTLVDHLGSVSSELNCSIYKNEEFSEAEVRINSLKQRLRSCEHYVHELALPKSTWNVNLPQLNRRYLSTPAATIVDKPKGDARSPAPPQAPSKLAPYQEDLPLFLYTYTPKPPMRLSSRRQPPEPGNAPDKLDSASPVIVLPVRDGFSSPSKGFSSTFDFQLRGQKHGRYSLFRKSAHNTNILSLLQRTKRLA